MPEASFQPAATSNGSPLVPERPVRARLVSAMTRGFRNRCPHCGTGRMFGRYLKVRSECTECGLSLEGHRADDLPPYVTIFLVGHVVGYLILEFEMGYEVPLWVSMTVWPLLTLGLAFSLLQPVKGAVVGLQYAFAMHGFDRLPAPTETPPSRTDHAAHGPAGAVSPVPRLGRL